MERFQASDQPQYKADLYWIPLGAGDHVVRLSGKIYEALTARIQHRKRQDLYHSALQVYTPEGRYVIEQTPVVNNHGDDRGVVSEGPVGMRWLGHFRHFRYENRCWLNGRIPDLNMAVGTPTTVSADPNQVRKIIEELPDIPTHVWGRDELATGDMWNSNSLISWVLDRSGVDLSQIHPPDGGRAPGWNAGIEIAHRERSFEDGRARTIHEMKTV